jgi:hypothetical protein
MEFAALSISLVALLVSAGAAERQRRVSLRATALPLVIDLFREYRSPTFLAARRVLADRLPGLDPRFGYSGLPPDVREHVQTMSYFFDNLGVMVASGLADPALVSAFAGESAEYQWGQLRPFIEGERTVRGGAWFQANFEDLVRVLREYPPGEIRRTLPRRRLA